MRDVVFIGTAFVAKYPTGGGSFWVPVQYLLGLRALGIEAYWIDLVWAASDGDVDRARGQVARLLAQAGELGVAEWAGAVVCVGSEADVSPPRREERFGAADGDVWARARDGLLLNVANSVPASLRSRFGRTALFDVDPGQFQLWAREVDLGVGSHDAYVTIGQNLGADDCPVPLDGVPWQRVWPVVHLPAWPVVDSPIDGRYTTVTQWWSERTWTVLGDEVIDGSKRTSFLRVLDLPGRVPVALELAANIHPGETDDLRRLDAHGWHRADPAVVAVSPGAFRRYVQGSRGEFSCAKPSYVRTRPGWISDRSVCYLASGRPCVVEATGAERHLPDSPALRFFRTEDEAAEQLRAIERDYGAATRAARALAEEVFATRVVVPQLLEATGLR
jgi:hypothetical protein